MIPREWKTEWNSQQRIEQSGEIKMLNVLKANFVPGMGAEKQNTMRKSQT